MRRCLPSSDLASGREADQCLVGFHLFILCLNYPCSPFPLGSLRRKSLLRPLLPNAPPSTPRLLVLPDIPEILLLGAPVAGPLDSRVTHVPDETLFPVTSDFLSKTATRPHFWFLSSPRFRVLEMVQAAGFLIVYVGFVEPSSMMVAPMADHRHVFFTSSSPR